MRCIFCHEDKPDAEFSVEHVFPEAIGGTLKIGCVCQVCNSRLGTRTDTSLVDNIAIQAIRHHLAIPNGEGRIPNPYSEGLLKQHPEFRASLEAYGATGTTRIKVFDVTTEPHPDGGMLRRTVCNSEDIEDIAQKRAARAQKAGKTVEKLSSHTFSVNNPSIIKPGGMRFVDMCAPCAKIAFEMGVHWLGQDYSDHPDAIRLARCATEDVDYDLPMSIDYFGRGTRALSSWKIPSWFHAACTRRISGRIWIGFRIFNVLEARVPLACNEADFPEWHPRWIALDPLAGKVYHGTGFEPSVIESDRQCSIRCEGEKDGRHRIAVTNAKGRTAEIFTGGDGSNPFISEK